MCLVAYTPAAYNAAAVSAERAAGQLGLFGAANASPEPVREAPRNRVSELLTPVMRMVEYAVPAPEVNESRFAEIEDEIYERWDGMA